MEKHKPVVAILIPCYNESLTIEKVIADFRTVAPYANIFVYDNNSTDDTFALAKNAGAYVGKEFRKGKANVIRRMFREIEADIYVMVDGDDTYPASALPDMLNLLIERKAEMVVGDRLSNKSYRKENKRRFHSFGNALTIFLINSIFNSNIKDVMSGYRVMTKKLVKNYPVISEQFELETEMTIFTLSHRLHIEELQVAYKDRPKNSHSKLNTFSDGLKVLATIFNLFRHYKPLFFFGSLSTVFLVTGIIMGIPVLVEYFTYQYVYKVPTLIVASAFVVLSLLSFGIGLILDTVSYGIKIQNELLIR